MVVCHAPTHTARLPRCPHLSRTSLPAHREGCPEPGALEQERHSLTTPQLQALLAAAFLPSAARSGAPLAPDYSDALSPHPRPTNSLAGTAGGSQDDSTERVCALSGVHSQQSPSSSPSPWLWVGTRNARSTFSEQTLPSPSCSPWFSACDMGTPPAKRHFWELLLHRLQSPASHRMEIPD